MKPQASPAEGAPAPAPKLGFFGQLSRDLLFYFNKRRTVRTANYRYKGILYFFVAATMMHLYDYIGSSEKFGRLIQDELPLAEFTPPELTKE